MKRVLFACLAMIALAAPAMGQSDCSASTCGSIPLMGVYDDAEWNTDLFFRVQGTGTIFFRFRPAPQTPFTQMQVYQLPVSGGYVGGVYDLVQLLYGDTEYDGILILDWATNDALEVEVLPLLRKNKTFAGVTLSYLKEAGCHLIPAPWSGGSTSISLQIHNPSETHAQTVTVNDSEVMVVDRSVIGRETFIVVDQEYTGAYVEICTGMDHPSSGGGIDYDQPVWVLPRFFHAGDRVTTRVW